MPDDLVPLPPQINGLPTPRDVGTMLVANLAVRVHHAREARGEVTQPEDVNALVRSLGGAKEMLEEYARAFSTAAGEASSYLKEELLSAVGEQDGVPLAGLKVPDTDGTDLVFTLNQPNSHQIDASQVINAVVADLLDTTRNTEPEQADNEDDLVYLARYEAWMAAIIRTAITRVLELGSFSMQVSKVKAYSLELAGHGADELAAVVRGSVTTTSKYTGVKFERRERKRK